ncbi:MAG: hypothetical protein JO043_03815 [Candidatus Eremiobacteraeota bacterium]|nr:hypothetical protein [Candidatus Eremiobacteraeota bacterium]
MLRAMVYSEWVTDLPQPAWAYNPPLRHDVPIATAVEALQQRVLERLLNPPLLERLDDMSLKYAANSTMTLGDLFGWTQASVFGDVRNGHFSTAGAVHRSLQQWYARRLAELLLAPKPGTPYDAQSLARAELLSLRSDVRKAQMKPRLEALTRAHLQSLEAVANQALSARMVAPVTQPTAGGTGM